MLFDERPLLVRDKRNVKIGRRGKMIPGNFERLVKVLETVGCDDDVKDRYAIAICKYEVEPGIAAAGFLDGPPREVEADNASAGESFGQHRAALAKRAAPIKDFWRGRLQIGHHTAVEIGDQPLHEMARLLAAGVRVPAMLETHSSHQRAELAGGLASLRRSPDAGTALNVEPRGSRLRSRSEVKVGSQYQVEVEA